ncbi:MAG TPA: helix-turn-helix transcriptional regulator [Ktedonobacteraceae bacterium]|nr:helix-turn-helix transcriptional regulator [Ktedonobacteraceae bacterium]
MVRLKIREIAESKGIGMSRLSRLADVHYKTIQHVWRDPTAGINTKTLEKIAKALEVSTADLIEDIPDENQDK